MEAAASAAGCGCVDGCVVSPEVDADPFTWPQTQEEYWTPRARYLAGRALPFCAEVSAGGRAGGGRAGGVQMVGAAAEDSKELRNIIAVGQKRFELAGKNPPMQPDIERLSERVIAVLGLNHGDAENRSGPTLNGCNCYLVGTGSKRILIDTAGPSPGPVENFDVFLENLEMTLEKEQCAIERIIITHGHTDHYGGCPEIQRRYGPVPCHMMTQGFSELRVGGGPSFVEDMKDRGIDKLLDDGEARPTEGAFQGNWWTKEINAEMFTAPLDPWPDDDDLSWVEPNEGRAQPLTKEYLAFHYFMSLRWNNAAMVEFRQRWLDDEDETMPAVVLQEGEIIKTEGATLRVEYGATTPQPWLRKRAFCGQDLASGVGRPGALAEPRDLLPRGRAVHLLRRPRPRLRYDPSLACL